MKTILPLLLAALALPAAATDYYLRGNDTSTNCSLDGNGSPVGWATTPGGAQASTKADDATGIYHINGNVFRIATSTENLSFGGARLVFDGTNPALNDKYTANATLTLDNLSVPDGQIGEIRAGNPSTLVLAGNPWTVGSGSFLSLNTGEKETRTLRILSTITGTGLLAATSGINDSRGVSTSGAGGTGTVSLEGDLSGFTGVLSAGEKGMTYEGGHATAVSHVTLKISAPSAFPQSTPDEDVLLGSVVVTNGATLAFACSVDSAEIRGWDFGTGAVPTVDVASGCIVRILGPVAGTKGINKTGSGTLIFNVGGDGAYGTITLGSGTQTVSAADLSAYAGQCEQWLEDRNNTGTASTIFFF